MTTNNPEQAPELIDSLRNGVLVLTLNRAEKLNALSLDLYDSLLSSLKRAQLDSAIGAVVITGAGSHFCAGGDVSRMASSNPQLLSREERIASLRERVEIVELLHTMNKPTIAMMRGWAVGAGMSIALACDLRYGDITTKLKTGFIELGLSGDFGGHYFLSRIIGSAKARELYLLSAVIGAERAEQLNILNAIYGEDELELAVLKIAEKLATRSKTAMTYIKQNLNMAANILLPEMLDEEIIRHIACTESEEFSQATKSFAKKRDNS